MSARDQLNVGDVVCVTLTRSRREEGVVTALLDDRFELELNEVENPDAHFSNVSAPAEHRTITIYFEDVIAVEPSSPLKRT